MLAIASNTLRDFLASTTESLRLSSGNLNNASGELNQIASRMTLGINEQFERTDQVATAMHEMSATAQEVARHAVEAAHAADDADSSARQGGKVMESTIQTITGMRSEIANTAEVIRRLEADSGRIGKVLEVIRGIAEQTNLLALNAAIEAARAGEQGRGFAVVADEVRKLAGNTQQAVQNTQELIEKIRHSSANAVNAIQQSQQLTHQAVGEADLAEAALDSIFQAIATINDMTYQIASAAEEQSSVSETVSGNLSKTNALANDIAQDATNTAKASQALRQAAERLQQLLGQFRLS